MEELENRAEGFRKVGIDKYFTTYMVLDLQQIGQVKFFRFQPNNLQISEKVSHSED